MGKGLLTLNPYHSDHTLLNGGWVPPVAGCSTTWWCRCCRCRCCWQCVMHTELAGLSTLNPPRPPGCCLRLPACLPARRHCAGGDPCGAGGRRSGHEGDAGGQAALPAVLPHARHEAAHADDGCAAAPAGRWVDGGLAAGAGCACASVRPPACLHAASWPATCQLVPHHACKCIPAFRGFCGSMVCRQAGMPKLLDLI